MSSTVLSTDAQPDALAMARKVILDPAGLDERHLEQVLDSVLSHAVDTADLYFQVSHEESWALEDSIVKEGSASIESGVGALPIQSIRRFVCVNIHYNLVLQWQSLFQLHQIL